MHTAAKVAIVFAKLAIFLLVGVTCAAAHAYFKQHAPWVNWALAGAALCFLAVLTWRSTSDELDAASSKHPPR